MGRGTLRLVRGTAAVGKRPPAAPRVLLIGPYDPLGGEYTFLAPPLGVWRLAGVLADAGLRAEVFDPNCCETAPESALATVLTREPWDVIGFSTTGMTLPHDLSLAHLTRRLLPGALLIAGGMEATFNPHEMFRLGPFDRVVLGEGEPPLLEIAARLRGGADLAGTPGTAFPGPDGTVRLIPRTAMNREELRAAIFKIPYERMPYAAYWRRLEHRTQVGELPVKAEREARLAEIRSVRLITLNYCPMGCAFCSSTQFLHAAQGGATAKVARLNAEECVTLIRRIVSTQRGVRTVIFQDDIFVFNKDERILPLCDALEKARERGDLPRNLRFISTNRIDAMNGERLAAMRRAGFHVLGFGVESFSHDVLKEFNKARIHPLIASTLEAALRLGITPFMDMILTSPRCRLEDLAENVRQALRWIRAGCEVGMYPYVIPFSGAPMAADPSLRPHTVYRRRQVAGTDVAWDQAVKILPADPAVRGAILAIEDGFETHLSRLAATVSHLPSRVRSLVWVASAIPVLEQAGCAMPSRREVLDFLERRLPGLEADPDDGRAERDAVAVGESLAGRRRGAW